MAGILCVYILLFGFQRRVCFVWIQTLWAIPENVAMSCSWPRCLPSGGRAWYTCLWACECVKFEGIKDRLNVRCWDFTLTSNLHYPESITTPEFLPDYSFSHHKYASPFA